jgi:cytochrome c553
MNYRSPKLLAAVRRLPCVECGAANSQAAHANLIELGKGKGIKAHDSAIMALCSACHAELDNGNSMSRDELRAFQYRAIVRTHMALWAMGLVEVA